MRPLSEVELAEARRIIAVQAGTMPEDGNIGPSGAWARAEHVIVRPHGKTAHEAMPITLVGLPTNKHLSRVRCQS